MTWKHHITMLNDSCQTKLSMLKDLSHKTWGADRAILLQLCIMMSKPKLHYGSEAYSSACSSLLSAQPLIQNCAIRTATGAYCSSLIPSIHADSGIKQLESYREVKHLNYYARIKVNAYYSLSAVLQHEDLPNDLAKSFLGRVTETMNEYNTEIKLMEEKATETIPWKCQRIKSCKDMYKIKKKDHVPQQLKEIFNRHQLIHRNTEVLYTDGLKTDQRLWYACVGQTIQRVGRIPDQASNYTPELVAIKEAVTDYR